MLIRSFDVEIALYEPAGLRFATGNVPARIAALCYLIWARVLETTYMFTRDDAMSLPRDLMHRHDVHSLIARPWRLGLVRPRQVPAPRGTISDPLSARVWLGVQPARIE